VYRRGRRLFGVREGCDESDPGRHFFFYFDVVAARGCPGRFRRARGKRRREFGLGPRERTVALFGLRRLTL